ncbi:MAG: TRAP transporter fused permease subunit [Desulfobacterales bacterium]|nr:TRAP transporter fused permease subunit [Desulfobacterales bacterium]MDD4392351.1 TRAP transporter fused permease subunit [Desulfobacterales bacterium]
MYDRLNKVEKLAFDILSVGLVLFYSFSAIIRPASTQYHRGILVIITYVLVFLLYRSKSRIMRVADYLLIMGSVIFCGYWMLNFEALNYRAGAETYTDQLIGVAGVLIGIEVARRVIGLVFVILGAVAIAYGVYGPYVPELFAHPGDSFIGMCTTIFYQSDGVFGIMADVVATYVLLFVLFGSFLEKSGAQKFFMDFPLAAVGHRTGGPAKVAVIASALFGSISGSAIANTVSTGAFTIPLMKKAGFRPHVAGAIEPAASIGGMFMPPIMGAGGFIMAELTGVSYSRIMLIALFPAFMYFFSVFVMVHYEAKAHNIRGVKSEFSPWSILKAEWYYMLPLILITGFMLKGYSAGFSAIIGILSCIAVSWVKKETRIDLKGFVAASRSGAESSLKIGATIGVIGIIISVLTYSGLILTFADIVIQLAGGKLFLTILLIAFASLFLGMGVPVTAAYLITAVVAVPALTHLGVNEVAAHMIVYWLSQDSNITPPVCIAAFAGATIARANMWRTAFSSFKFAKFLYLGPFLFGYVPGFSLQGDTADIIKVFVLVTIGTFSYSWFLSLIWWYKIKEMWKKRAVAA